MDSQTTREYCWPTGSLREDASMSDPGRSRANLESLQSYPMIWGTINQRLVYSLYDRQPQVGILARLFYAITSRRYVFHLVKLSMQSLHSICYSEEENPERYATSWGWRLEDIRYCERLLEQATMRWRLCSPAISALVSNIASYTSEYGLWAHTFAIISGERSMRMCYDDRAMIRNEGQ